MATFGNPIKIGVAAVLLLAGLTTAARGQVAGGGLSVFGGESRGIMQITGKVVCSGCSLDEVRKAQPNQHSLYQFTHKRGQIVMAVSMVEDAQRWNTLTGSPQLWIRADDQLLQKLSAEENLFKEIEITGLLNNTRTLDVFDVAVHG